MHIQPRQDPLFWHGRNARHGNMHDISSEDDDLHNIPRHHGPWPNRHHHGNILDNISLFGDPTLENRHIGAKLDIPSFEGSTNPEKYLKWEMKLDHIFDIQRFDDNRKIALATLHLNGMP